MRTTLHLAHRLRQETADDHARAERALGLPGSVASKTDYARLVARLVSFHVSAETTLADSRWSGDLHEVGIDVRAHERSHLLKDDLWVLHTARPLHHPMIAPEAFTSLGAVLGLLYVVEGSALGGIILGPMIRKTLGDVPTRFYDNDGRDHPHPWRSLQAGLTTYEKQGGDPDAVIHGARSAFALIGTNLAFPLWSSVR